MGRWLPDAKGPGERGDQRPCCEGSAVSGLGEGTVFVSRFGDPGLDGKGDAPGYGECWVGERVKRKMRGSICQNDVWLTNIFVQPSPLLSSDVAPTHDSSLAIRPILSSFGSRCFPLNMPSRLILTRH